MMTKPASAHPEPTALLASIPIGHGQGLPDVREELLLFQPASHFQLCFGPELLEALGQL
jgi:hypothetical protein